MKTKTRKEGRREGGREGKERTAATPALLLLRNIRPNASVAPGAVTSVFTYTPS